MINMIYPEISKGFLNQLENIINKYGIDSLTGIEDFLLTAIIQKYLDSLIWLKYEQAELRGKNNMIKELIQEYKYNWSLIYKGKQYWIQLGNNGSNVLIQVYNSETGNFQEVKGDLFNQIISQLNIQNLYDQAKNYQEEE